jgi:phage terminase large subunit-like protein
VLGGIRETLVIIPKGNAKTTLLSGIALYHLLFVPDASVPIGAASREQAGILFRQASGFIRRNPQLAQYLKVQDGYRRILNTVKGGVLQVYASDADTGDGVIPTLALIDELHRHKNDGLYGVWRDGLGKRGGQIVTISTAGDDEESPLGQMRAAALQLPGVRRRGAHTVARSSDFVMHEWALAKGDDVDDLKLVKTANPLAAVTIEELRKRHDSPSMTPWQWARFACGVWMNGEESWIDPADWDACRGTVELEAGQDAFVGVDVGHKKDSTALAIVGWVDDKLHVRVKIMTPTDGQPNAAADARREIGELNDAYRLVEVPYDPWHFSESAEMLADRGVPMVEFPQTDGRMAPASEALYELIRAGRLVHDGDPELRRQVLAAVPARTERGVKISKRKSKRRIDAAVALAMAAHRAIHGRNQTELIFEVYA